MDSVDLAEMVEAFDAVARPLVGWAEGPSPTVWAEEAVAPGQGDRGSGNPLRRLAVFQASLSPLFGGIKRGILQP